MNSTDQQKVLKAGFTIIRKYDLGPLGPSIDLICKTPDKPFWHNYTVPFSSKNQRRIYMDKFLKSDHIIED